MKNTKALAMLVMAILIGLAAAVYAAGWVNRQSSTPHKVVVAAVDIELGSRINAPMLSTVDWPSGALPAGAFSDPKDVQDRVLKVGVMRGDAIVDRKLAPTGAQGGLSAVIADGKRAMTVRVNDVVGVAGFALPGTFVDVMVNAQQEHGRGEEGRQQVREEAAGAKGAAAAAEVPVAAGHAALPREEGGVGGDPGDKTNKQRFPQRLTHQMRDLRRAASADFVRHQRIHRHQDAHDGDDHDRPYGGTE